MKRFKKLLNNEQSGAVAFEYIIILVIMVVAIFAAWSLLSDEIGTKAGEIQQFIAGNGQNALGTH